ncbi:MAG: fimbrillin family protein [Rikenellaceae bacterium]
MNRFFFSFIVLFALACNRVETIDTSSDLSPESPLGILISTDSYTKGEIVEYVKNMGSIGVYCAFTGEDNLSSTTEFLKMSNRRFNVSSIGECEIEGDAEYWAYGSPDDKYTFYAYSPHNRDYDFIVPSIVNGELVINYTVPDSSIYQLDLMFATPHKNIAPYTTGSVPLTFSHILSCVSFKVVSSTDDKIDSIKVTGVANKGTFMWGDGLSTESWNLEKDVDENFIVEVDDYTVSEGDTIQVNTNRGYLMMIPQTLTNGAEVTLILETGDEYVLDIPAGTVWEPGVKYNYVISLDDDGDFIFYSSQISNCYIVNPTVGEETIVQIPVQDRINDFWINYSGLSKYSKGRIASTNSVDDFTAQLVWEDFDCDVDIDFELVRDVSDKMAVRFVLPENMQEGNLVFAVKEDNVNMWSWHIWVTDYDPDAIAKAHSKNIRYGIDTAYTLAGYEGAVHRYKDGDVVDSCAVWSGIYKEKFIMDRNIGERNGTTATHGVGAVYYEFGRKDPFPGTCGLYFSGATDPGTRTSSNQKYYNSVEFTVDYFVSSASSDNWCGESEVARDSIYIWYDGDISKYGYSVGKSIFDPSPLGWRIPVGDTWNGFNKKELGKKAYNKALDTYNYNNYGYRNPDNYGNVAYSETLGCVWSANQKDTYRGLCFNYSDATEHPPTPLIVTYGFPIRAIQE